MLKIFYICSSIRHAKLDCKLLAQAFFCGGPHPLPMYINILEWNWSELRVLLIV